MEFDYNSIRTRIRNDLTDAISKIEGTFSMDNVQAVSNELARLYSMEIATIAERYSLDTTKSKWLDKKGIDFNETRYEKMFGLPVGNDQTEQRQNKIIAKLNTRSPATVARIKAVVSIITGQPCEITEHYPDYMFTIKFTADYEVNVKLLRDIKGAVDEIKPAHLGYKAVLQKVTCAPVFTAMRHTVATYIKVYPYQPDDLTAQTTSTGIAFTKIAQRIMVHPLKTN